MQMPTVDQVNAMLREEFPAAERTVCEELGPGWAVARWRFDDSVLRPGGYISGPVQFGLADTALWFAAFTEIGIEPMSVTSELSIRFLRPATAGDLLARATLQSVSRRRLVGTVELWIDGDPDRLVSVAQGTYVRPTEPG